MDSNVAISKPSMSLGPNPVDPTLAFRAAVESSLDIVSSINECSENGRDYGKNVTITLNGTSSEITGNGKTVINLTSVLIEDDGIGMDFATMCQNFRGAYYDSRSHERTDQSGRNGVGVKTNLQYWKEIRVKTTTRGLIPGKSEWKCADEKIRNEIDANYQKITKLTPRSPDTEERSMILRVDGADLLPFQTVARDDSYTIVELALPRQKIELCVEDFIRKQSHCIDWLTKSGNKLTVQYTTESGKAVKKEIRPFYEIDGKDKFICHLKGRSNSEMFINWKDRDGTKNSKIIPVPEGFSLDPIDIDIKVLDHDPDDLNPNDFVMSICGANVYDRKKSKSSVPPSVEYLLSQDHFRSSNGFSYRLHGYIKTSDERLKRALRYNKSVLDEEDRYARSFIQYLVKTVLWPMNDIYNAYNKVDNDHEDTEILDEIRKEFNTVVDRVRESQKKTPQDPPTEGVAPKHKEFKCDECGLVWKVPLDKSPSYCAEFNVTGDKGCGSRAIARNTHAKTDTGALKVKFEWTNSVGGFLPARYDESSNTIFLSKYHPVYVTKVSAAKAKIHKYTVGLEQAFFAMARHNSVKSGTFIDQAYGEFLKVWFENRSNKDPFKAMVKKMWKDNRVTIDQL